MDINKLLHIGILKTVYINLRCCKFKDAIRIPIIVSRDVSVCYSSGCVLFREGVKTGVLTIGFNRKHINGNPSTFNIKGRLVINGTGHHAIGAGCCIEVCKNGELEIGDKFALAGNSTITVNHHIKIGNNNLWSYNNVVMDYDSHSIFDIKTNKKINNAQEVVFDDNVWMGCGCTILKGAYIPKGTVIAAKSIITKKISGENKIIGTQGKVLRENVKWKG